MSLTSLDEVRFESEGSGFSSSRFFARAAAVRSAPEICAWHSLHNAPWLPLTIRDSVLRPVRSCSPGLQPEQRHCCEEAENAASLEVLRYES